ncbi:hypothetical protein JTB14_018658 [Gonioctena quinquepunctata]|nr:hypothetical protein JTB14_018658 [Gonioctena quinquepunctata]
MWSHEREQARLQEMLEILNDEEGQGVAYDEHSDIDQSDDDEVDHVEEQHDNSDSEQDISDDGEMVEESHSNTLSFIGKDKVTLKPHLQVRAAMSNIPRSLRSRLLSGSNIEPDVPQNASVEKMCLLYFEKKVANPDFNVISAIKTCV